MESFPSTWIKETLDIHENTLIKFFTSIMQRLEIKIDRISYENTVPKQEDKNLKAGGDFWNKWFREAKRDLEV